LQASDGKPLKIQIFQHKGPGGFFISETKAGEVADPHSPSTQPLE